MKQPHNYTTPNWEPLERAVRAAGLPLSECADWMWMYEQPGGFHAYKHRDTRHYAVLTVSMEESEAARRLQSARSMARPAERFVVPGGKWI